MLIKQRSTPGVDFQGATPQLFAEKSSGFSNISSHLLMKTSQNLTFFALSASLVKCLHLVLWLRNAVACFLAQVLAFARKINRVNLSFLQGSDSH